MVTNSIIELVNKVVMSFFSGWEDIDLLIPMTAFNTLEDIFAFLFYILPINGIVTMVGIIVSIMTFRIIISLIKTLWELIPIL